MTYQGLAGLLTRSIGGLTSELPLYWFKFTKATDTCIQGQSIGKAVSLIINY